MLDQNKRDKIRKAFKQGSLMVNASTEAGLVGRYPVSDILCHHTPHKMMLKIEAGDYQVVCTEDHSLFTLSKDGGIQPTKTDSFKLGDPLVVISGEGVSSVPVSSISEELREESTYDLSVPGPQNFFLSNGILAHNSYSIGGVSLDIERSSKYQSLMESANSQFDKATEAKARTVKFIRGLQQPKYGIGIRSAFGPHVGRGILSPRNFI